MTEHYGFHDDLTLPFIFVPHGQGEMPEVQEFKARYPGWFTIPATFVPHDTSEAPDDAGWSDGDADPWPDPVPSAPRPTGAARTLDDGMPSSVRAFQRAYTAHGDASRALRALRDTPDAFADAATPPTTQARDRAYVAADPERWEGKPSVGSGECVPLVQQATGAPHTSKWHRGAAVRGNLALRPGTAIATFDDDGRYGNHSDGRSHAAIYLSQDAHGIRVIDQWNWRKNGRIDGHHRPGERLIKFDNRKSQDNDGNMYYVVQ